MTTVRAPLLVLPAWGSRAHEQTIVNDCRDGQAQDWRTSLVPQLFQWAGVQPIGPIHGAERSPRLRGQHGSASTGTQASNRPNSLSTNRSVMTVTLLESLADTSVISLFISRSRGSHRHKAAPLGQSSVARQERLKRGFQREREEGEENTL